MALRSLVVVATLASLGCGSQDANGSSLRAGMDHLADGQDATLGAWASRDACWKDSRGRGVGEVANTCKSDEEKNGLLCYPKCKSGYTGYGPVCWEDCPAGSKDGGVFCKSNAKVHLKESYGRGVGGLMSCAKGEESDKYFFGLCYPVCKSSEKGVGPVCWSDCPSQVPYDGGAMCCKDKESCKAEVNELAVKLPIAVAKAVLDKNDLAKEIADVKNIVEDLMGVVLPLCSQVK